jgi:hypothetical protein
MVGEESIERSDPDDPDAPIFRTAASGLVAVWLYETCRREADARQAPSSRDVEVPSLRRDQSGERSIPRRSEARGVMPITDGTSRLQAIYPDDIQRLRELAVEPLLPFVSDRTLLVKCADALAQALAAEPEGWQLKLFDYIESEEFESMLYAYRCAPSRDSAVVWKAFEAVKAALKNEITAPFAGRIE